MKGTKLMLLGLLGGLSMPPVRDLSGLPLPPTTSTGKYNGSVNNPGKRGKFKRRNRKG